MTALAGAGAWLWQGASSSTSASEESALSRFRDRGDLVAARRPGVPSPGVYSFRQTGQESAGGGPLEVSRDLPARALYVITPIPGGYHEDLRFSEEHIEEVRFQVDARGTRALSRRTKVTFLGVGEDETSDQAPPPLDHPARLRVGSEWSGRYASGEVPVSFHARVVARRPAALDGRQVETFVIRTDSETGGSRPGTRRDEVWWAPSLALPVRWTIAQDYGGATTFEMNATLELQSATPQV